MIGLGSDVNIEQNQIIAMLCSAVILSYPLSCLNVHPFMNHNPCLDEISHFFIIIFESIVELI